MTSSAISAQGVILQIGTGSSGAKTLTAATQTNPCVLTSAAHGLVVGDIGVIASVVGMTQLNGQTCVVQYVTTNTIGLANVNATSYTAYSSGGTFTPTAFAAIANCKTFNGFDGQASEIDVTNFASTGKEFRLGLFDGGSLKVEIDIDNSDAGQAACFTAAIASTLKTFRLILPSGTTPTYNFSAFVKQFSSQGGVDQVVKGSLNLRISGGYTKS